MIAGFPSGTNGVCEDAFSVMIDRITPWPFEPPLQACTGPDGSDIDYSAPSFSSTFQGVIFSFERDWRRCGSDGERDCFSYDIYAAFPDGSYKTQLADDRATYTYDSGPFDVSEWIGDPSHPSMLYYDGPDVLAELSRGYYQFVWIFSYRRHDGEWTTMGPYEFGNRYR